MLKSLAWFVMTFLALAVAGYAAAVVFFPDLRPQFARAILAAMPVAGLGHFGGGAVALSTGAFQVNSGFRTRFLNVHRWLGRVYLIGVAVGGTAGLVLAVRSSGGLIAHFGFGLLAICWLGGSLAAFHYILVHKLGAHRAWMIRSYALTLAAVTLRIYLPASQIAGIPFATAYPFISWLCWVPNLLAAEWFIRSDLSRAPLPPRHSLEPAGFPR